MKFILLVMLLLMPPVDDGPLLHPGDLVRVDPQFGERDGVGVVMSERRWNAETECVGYDVQFELVRRGVRERYLVPAY